MKRFKKLLKFASEEEMSPVGYESQTDIQSTLNRTRITVGVMFLLVIGVWTSYDQNAAIRVLAFVSIALIVILIGCLRIITKMNRRLGNIQRDISQIQSDTARSLYNQLQWEVSDEEIRQALDSTPQTAEVASLTAQIDEATLPQQAEHLRAALAAGTTNLSGTQEVTQTDEEALSELLQTLEGQLAAGVAASNDELPKDDSWIAQGDTQELSPDDVKAMRNHQAKVLPFTDDMKTKAIDVEAVYAAISAAEAGGHPQSVLEDDESEEIKAHFLANVGQVDDHEDDYDTEAIDQLNRQTAQELAVQYEVLVNYLLLNGVDTFAELSEADQRQFTARYAAAM